MQLQWEDHDGLLLITVQLNNWLLTWFDALNKSVQLQGWGSRDGGLVQANQQTTGVVKQNLDSFEERPVQTAPSEETNRLVEIFLPVFISTFAVVRKFLCIVKETHKWNWKQKLFLCVKCVSVDWDHTVSQEQKQLEISKKLFLCCCFSTGWSVFIQKYCEALTELWQSQGNVPHRRFESLEK